MPVTSPLPDPCRPLLKWAGGKRQLLPAIRAHYPAAFGRYIEPFLGSGAVFFDLAGSGALSGHEAVLSDCNDALIGCYQAVRDDPNAVTAALADLADRERYLNARSTLVTLLSRFAT